MIHSKRLMLGVIGAVFLGGVGLQSAVAQTYPNKPIRFVVPFPPGGGTDTISRIIANKMAENTGWVFVVENKPGSGGSVGLGLASKASNDGYTLVLGQNANLVIAPILGKANYDPVRDFASIGMVADAPQVLVVPKDSPIKSLSDLLSAAKKNPGKVRFASPGIGTSSHLAGELLQQLSGTKFRHIPYKGANQALPDFFGGRVDLYVSSVPSAMPHIREGMMRPLGVFAKTRDVALPDVPTFAEQGLSDSEAITWWGLAAPAGTSPTIIKQLNLELNKALSMKETQAQIKKAGANTLGGTAQTMEALIKSDVPKWRSVAEKAGVISK